MRSRVALLTVATVVALFALSGYSLAEEEDCEEADVYYEHAIKELSQDEEIAYALQKAVELCPSHLKARHSLADTLVRLNKLDEAAKHYEELVELKAKIPAAYASLGDLYCVQGRYEMAKKAYEDALALNTDDRTIRSRLKGVNEKIKTEKGGFKPAAEIVKRVTRSIRSGGYLKKMGIAKYTEAKERIRFNNILFREWSFDLDQPEAIHQLDEVANALKSTEVGRIRVLVEGHTDDRGGLDRNEKLSWDRAESVKRYLVQQCGLDPSRVDTQGYGYLRPRFPNDTPEHMRENRRVEVVFFP